MPLADLAAIKSRLADPDRVLRALGLDPRRQGRDRIVLCPAHNENTPSCVVTSRDGELLWHCHGCGSGGDALSLVATVAGLSIDRDFPAVVRRAAELAGGHVETVAEPRPRPRAVVPPRPPPLDLSPFVLHLAHVGRLDASPISADVTAYLERRGVLDEARADGWFALPPPGEAQESWVRLMVDVHGPAKVGAAGLVRGKVFSFADNRLCIPWRGPGGEVVTLQRRRLDGEKDHKYVFAAGHSPTHPYGVDRLRAASDAAELVIVEGAIDVLARRVLDRGKDRIALGLPGVDAWKTHGADWASMGRGRRVLLALDADTAGNRSIGAMAEDFNRAGAVEVIRSRPVGGAKDWCEVLEKRIGAKR